MTGKPDGGGRGARSWSITPIASATLISAIMIATYLAFGEAALDGLGSARTEVVILLGIAALVADIFLPIPSSVVIVLVAQAISPVPAILTGALGLSLGCALGYASGRLGSRYLVDADRADRLSVWLRQRGGIPLLVALRPVPILGETSLIVAGLLRLNPFHVLATTSIANLALATCYVLLAAQANSVGGFVASILAAWSLPGLAMLAYWLIRRGSSTAAETTDRE